MKVIKPNKLSVITRCFEHQREFMMGVSVLAFIPLTPPDEQAPLLSELALWTFVPERLGKDAVLDAGVPKSRAEFLIHGSGYAPGGQALPSFPVHARVGERAKSLVVHGDRGWLSDEQASEAKPVRVMPLSWARAFGGPSFAQNPLGKGHDALEVDGEAVRLLPNLEYPAQPLERATDVVAPAAYGPLDIAWPQRAELAGTYDEAWLEQGFPGFARDIDWRMFNLAPGDQQIDGVWAAGDSYRFDNMHPERPRIDGRLPPYRARAFVTRELGPAPPEGSGESAPTRFDEVPLRLSTLWFFPDAERAVLIFHGSTKLRTDDGADIRHLVLAAEGPNDAREVADYEAVLAARLDPELGGAASLRDHELLPSGMPEHVDETLAEAEALVASEQLVEANLYRRAVAEHEAACEQLKALGLDPAKYAPPVPEPPQAPPPLDELPAFFEQVKADAEARKAEELAKVAERRALVEAELRAAGIDPVTVLGDPDKPAAPSGPPSFTAEGQRVALAALIAQSRAAGAPTEHLEAMLASPELQVRWQQAELDAREAYRASAHLQQPAPALDAAHSEAARQAVLAAARDRVDFSTLNLTGADLRGLDLRGANLSGACLESATLDGADLTRACLSKAILAHASLVGAKLDDADLSEANLGGADLREASITRSKLERTVLAGADLRGASLRESRLVKLGLLLGTKLDRADLGGAIIEELVLMPDGSGEQVEPGDAESGETSMDAGAEAEADAADASETLEIEGLRLAGARLSQATLIRVALAKLDAAEASFERSSFVACAATGAAFDGARFDRVAFVEDCALAEASFAGATLVTTNLRRSQLRGASFEDATLDASDLSGSDLREARFARASAVETLFVGADLRGAVLSPANLMGASLKGAQLVDADLRGSNLHGADLARVRTEGRVQLERALLTKVRIHPTYAEAPDDPT